MLALLLAVAIADGGKQKDEGAEQGAWATRRAGKAPTRAARPPAGAHHSSVLCFNVTHIR